MSWYYRRCPVCSDGGSSYSFAAGKGKSDRKPAVTVLMLISTISGNEPRKQKSSGSTAMCADCLAKVLDGGPLPKSFRDGMAEALKLLNVEVQRALPLSAPKKRKAKT